MVVVGFAAEAADSVEVVELLLELEEPRLVDQYSGMDHTHHHPLEQHG